MDDFTCSKCQKSFKTRQALSAHHGFHVAASKKANSGDQMELFDKDEMTRVDLLNGISPEPNVEPSFMMTDPDDFCPTIVKVKKLPHGKNLPDLKRATSGSAAVDLYAAIDKPKCVGVNERESVPTGIAVEIPQGFVGKVVPRSGLAFNHGISLVNTPGIIDSDYRGEIKVCLINHSRAKFWVEPGDRIAQMLIERVEPVEFEYVTELEKTERGTGGFGSSGMR